MVGREELGKNGWPEHLAVATKEVKGTGLWNSLLTHRERAEQSRVSCWHEECAQTSH